MKKLVVKPGLGYMKIAWMFFIYAIIWFILIIVSYAPVHDPADSGEFILLMCGLPAAVGMVPAFVYRNVKMIFDNDGVASSNILGLSKRYSWKDINEARLLNNSQYRCVIYANGHKVGSAIFSYDGYTQLLDLLIRKRLLEKSGIVEKAKRRAGISQPGGLSGAFFKNKRK